MNDLRTLPLFAPRCSACGKRCEKGNEPLKEPTAIRSSAKFKGRVFAVGDRLCSAHHVRPATPKEVEAARAAIQSLVVGEKILAEMAEIERIETMLKGAR